MNFIRQGKYQGCMRWDVTRTKNGVPYRNRMYKYFHDLKENFYR